MSLAWPLPYQLIGLIGTCICAVGYLLYRLALPKPIPGIPYNKHSASRLLGDLPDALRWRKERSEMMSFLTAQTNKLRSPIVQVFMAPMGRPWVVITDFREAQDIMARRTKEFDRSAFFGDMLYTLGPNNQVHMPTGDVWRMHRKLMGDTMSPSFLSEVSGPQIHSESLVTVNLWREKVRLAGGHPFEVAKDVNYCALDIIWAVTFGSEMGTSKTQLTLLSEVDSVPLADETDIAVTFPAADDPAAFSALTKLADSVEMILGSPVPRLHHELALRLMPSLSAARKLKDQLLKDHLHAAWERLQHDDNAAAVKSALDLVVQREAIMAKKDGRPAQYDTPTIRDELFGYLVAGYDTTSTTICWGLKFLTRGSEAQAKLRFALQAEFKRAREARDNPTVEEIVRANVPYLDATLEEIHRCGGTVSANIRTALEDTEVLGHLIPKGTDVFMMMNGPGYVQTHLPVEESMRSQSSKDSKDKNGEWEASGIDSFAPERWLVEGESGELEFNARAGPAHPFGAGPRGCFGRRLASLELKIMITLVIWNFELLPTPTNLSSFAGRDKLTRGPQQCYLRLAEVNHG